MFDDIHTHKVRVLRLKTTQTANQQKFYTLTCKKYTVLSLFHSPSECWLCVCCPGGNTKPPDHPHHNVGTGDVDVLWLWSPPLSTNRLQRLARREQINYC